jgi:hypothetical protein
MTGQEMAFREMYDRLAAASGEIDALTRQRDALRDAAELMLNSIDGSYAQVMHAKGKMLQALALCVESAAEPDMEADIMAAAEDFLSDLAESDQQ